MKIKTNVRLFSIKGIEKLIEKYRQYPNPQIIEIEEGVLGYGTTILLADGCKAAVVKEVFINSWSSGHSVRLYNELPKKYSKQL
jgi:hypothetical protein